MWFYPKISDSLHRLFQRIHLKPCTKFHNMLFLSDERLLMPNCCQLCLFNVFTSTTLEAISSIYSFREWYLCSAFLSFMNDTTKIHQTLTTLILYFGVCSWTYFFALFVTGSLECFIDLKNSWIFVAMQDCQISLEMLWSIQSSKFVTQIHIILRNLFQRWMQFSVQKLKPGEFEGF